MKKIAIFLILILIIISSCSSNESELIINIKKNIIKINNMYRIDVKKSDNEILSNFGKYEEEEFPYGIFYDSNEYPIQLVYENEKNKISNMIVYFGLEKYGYKYIRIKINKLLIDTNTSFDSLISYFDKNKIKYSINKKRIEHVINFDDYMIYAIWYDNKNLNEPSSININLDKL